ncbi:MAG: M16 family metallopeptidase [Gemmatimonadota bacterium]
MRATGDDPASGGTYSINLGSSIEAPGSGTPDQQHAVVQLMRELSVARHVLGNGMTVLVREDHSAPVAAVVTWVKAGYFDETDDVIGISHVLEHMYFKGTPTWGVGEIAQQTKASGGYLNAATIYDHTSYYAVLPSAGFARGLAIQADAYANSLVDEGELARELEVIIEEARRKRDTPSALTTETLFELLHDRHRIRRWRIGHEWGLRTLNREAVVRFYRNYYRPSNTILVVAGDVETEETLRRVETLYGGLEPGEVERDRGPRETAPPGRRFRELSGDIQQTQFAFGWRSGGTLEAAAPALEVAASILGSGRASRLYRGVRNRGLATSVGAYDYTPTEIGVFVISGVCDPDMTNRALQHTWREIRSLASSATGTELARVKRILEARWLRRLETMEGQANHLAEWEALGDWRLGDEVLARTLAVASRDVARAVEERLTPADAALLVYRPEESPSFARDAEAAFARLDGDGLSVVSPLEETPAFGTPIVQRRPELETVVGDVHVFRTSSGVPILVARKSETPIAHFGFCLLGGTLREQGEEAGFANLVARTSLQGTTRRDADGLASAAELLGGSIGPVVGSDSMSWGMSVPLARVDEAVHLLAEVALDPTFPSAAVDRERRLALSQLAQMRDDMHRYPMRLALEEVWGRHAYGRPTLGDPDVLERANAPQLRNWHAENVRTSMGVLAFIGDLEPAVAAATMDSAFHDLQFRNWTPGESPRWRGGGVRVESRDKAQSALVMLFPGPSRRDSDRFAARMLCTIASGLGGRLFEELRDRQSLAYTVTLSTHGRLKAGQITAYIACAPDKEEAARRGLIRELERLHDEDVMTRELERGRAYMTGSHAISRQSAGVVLDDMVDSWLLGDGLGELADVDRRIASVTAADIRSVARRYLNVANRVEGIVRGGA